MEDQNVVLIEEETPGKQSAWYCPVKRAVLRRRLHFLKSSSSHVRPQCNGLHSPEAGCCPRCLGAITEETFVHVDDREYVPERGAASKAGRIVTRVRLRGLLSVMGDRYRRPKGPRSQRYPDGIAILLVNESGRTFILIKKCDSSLPNQDAKTKGIANPLVFQPLFAAGPFIHGMAMSLTMTSGSRQVAIERVPRHR
jgi:hypothetical protein